MTRKRRDVPDVSLDICSRILGRRCHLRRRTGLALALDAMHGRYDVGCNRRLGDGRLALRLAALGTTPVLMEKRGHLLLCRRQHVFAAAG